MMTLAQRLALPDVAKLPDWAAAGVLNEPDPSLPELIEWQPTAIGIGAVLDALGPEAGARLLDALVELCRTQPVLRWGYRLIEDEKLDLSRPSARDQLTALVANNALTPEQADKLLALSRRTRHPSWAEATSTIIDARAVGLARGGR